ncbi:hypothetical protein Plhal304r1_c014g0051891 [Plasmopara halstedii]
MTHCITAQEFWPVDLEKFHHVCPAYDSARQEAFLMLDRVAFGVGEDGDSLSCSPTSHVHRQ